MLAHMAKYRLYYTFSILFILVGLVGLLIFERGELVSVFNRNQSDAMNQFFMWSTRLAEVSGGVGVFLILLLTARYKYLILFVVSVALTTGATQGLKRLVFDDAERPAKMLSDLNPIDHLDRHTDFSFPSGHTTAAFTFFTVLALALQKKRYQFISFSAASIAAVSRIYLGQHFLYDVVVGAIIGLVITTLVHLSLSDTLDQYPRWNKKLIH